jgi:hypothetical protein
MRYRVIYLIRAKRALDELGLVTLAEAELRLRSYKRLGMTAWIEDELGAFVPVKGARRKPGELR